MSEIKSVKDYENGLKCSHMGIKTEDMSKSQLIELVGQLDNVIKRLQTDIASLECRVVNIEKRLNYPHLGYITNG